MKYILLFFAVILLVNNLFAQTGTDTIHYKKVYYFAGTGIGIPLGKTKEVLSTKLFAGSMGLDIALKNPKYYLSPALYMLSFSYDQQIKDKDFNTVVKRAPSNFYILSLAAGTRRQFNRLNMHAFVGPTVGLANQPRSTVMGDLVELSYLRNLTLGTKIGLGGDYRFKGFYLGTEFGYIYNVNKVEGRPFHAMTFMVGLKSDITKLTDKVVRIIVPEQ